MSSDGVMHVVFVGYPDPVPSAPRARMDALRPLLESACAESDVPCTWVDLRPAFMDRYSEYVQADGLNLTDAGAATAAQVVSLAMEENCVPR
jgi:hypothetical protein